MTREASNIAAFVDRERREIAIVAGSTIAEAGTVLEAVQIASGRGMRVEVAIANAKRWVAAGVSIRDVRRRLTTWGRVETYLARWE